MVTFPQEIIDLFVDFTPLKADLKSLSLAHRSFLRRSRYHLFSTIRFIHGANNSPLNYKSTSFFKVRNEGLALPKYLTSFRSTITQNPLIVSSVRTLSLFTGYTTLETDDFPEDLPFTKLHSLQVRFARHLDLTDVLKTQKWRVPPLIRLIQTNPSLQHLAIDACSLEPSSWDTLFSNIASLKQLHTLVLRSAVTVTSEDGDYEAQRSLSLPATPLTTKPSLRKLYVACNDPELKRVAISLPHYFTITQLNVLALQCSSSGWSGQEAVLMNCGNRLVSLSIGVEFWRNNAINVLVGAPAFSNLSHLQLTFEACSELKIMANWLIKERIPLRLLHLTCEKHSMIAHEIRTVDNVLLNLVTSIPSLQLIAAYVIMYEELANTKDLADILPQTFGTGKLKYRPMMKWWEV
ncbi:hypothetical protein BDP27DRAFT_519208 [Rhodocollybia butyracea]|uniref:F-box domain-containing protein n=1 Tax=Rhodocollybia butyracea TaxID=206335 RepID=A0A9P5PZQ1_9AGAR|nr:hypothetical protein BDP27DRAFT_519208 [Rhodocollybia butyracea]